MNGLCSLKPRLELLLKMKLSPKEPFPVGNQCDSSEHSLRNVDIDDVFIGDCDQSRQTK